MQVDRSRSSSSRFKQRGFTLIEILVAILLFAIGALALTQVQARSMKGTTFGKDALNAAVVAQRTIEGLKNGATANIWAGTAAMSGGPTAVADVPGMTVQWNAGAADASGFRQIRVTIQWANGTQNYIFDTILAQN
jgi:type IV pilus assembly protein PilV